MNMHRVQNRFLKKLPQWLAPLLFLPVASFAQTLTFQPLEPTSWFQPTFEGTDDEGQPVTRNVWFVMHLEEQPAEPPLPGPVNVAVITNARHAIIEEGDVSVDIMRISNNEFGGRLDLLGGTFDVARAMQMATAGDGLGMVLIDGGFMAVGTRMQLASNNSATARGHLIYRSGTVILNAFDVGTLGYGLVSLEGSNADNMRAGNLFLGGGVEGVLRFVFDAEGAPFLRLTSALTLNANGSLLVDGSAYRGESDTFMLIEAGNLESADFTGDVTQVVFPANYDVTLRQENQNLYIDVVKTGEPIPEPDPESFWKDEPDVSGFKETDTALGMVYDEHFPWIYSAVFESWLYVHAASGSAGSFSAYHMDGIWFHLATAYHGYLWNYTAGEWQEPGVQPD